ncbi:MAG: hypothetical protein SFU91_13345 [Chloroherpetonaceae bacterium]|nr:hypothetical protein [Chloroherpetonaceae bacterium]
MLNNLTEKEILKERKKIIDEIAIPNLLKNGFEKAPFSTSWFGEYDRNIAGYSYELGKINDKSHLVLIYLVIVKGDRWIKVKLSIYNLIPSINSIENLKTYEGINFEMPPNDEKIIQLRLDDYINIPPFIYLFFFPKHKIGTAFTKFGIKYKINKLKNLIDKDTNNIDKFIERWYKKFTPNNVDWNGNIIN